MRILVIGKNSQLGKSIKKLVHANVKVVNHDFIFVGREELDLSNNKLIQQYFSNNDAFDIFINCAAYTQVDKAESEEELANQVNHLAVYQLASVAETQKAKLIHISTDYVFDGESDEPYLETDVTNPINIYGKTKLSGELALKKRMPTNGVIIRTSWLYSEYGNNFVDTILRLGREREELGVVSDQIGSPTYATDLASLILRMIAKTSFRKSVRETQVYHYSSEAEMSWYTFTKEIFKIEKVDCKVNPIRTIQYPTPAKRPPKTIMNNEKIYRDFFQDEAHRKKYSYKSIYY